MSNLTRNTAELEAILATVNALPSGGGSTPEDLDAVLTEQEALIAELQAVLAKKASDGGEVVEPIIEPLDITENGTYTAPNGVDGYSPITVNVPTGGTDARFADFAMDNLTVIDDETITKFRPYAFSYAENLVTVRLPNARMSATSVFRDCSKLESVDLPALAGTSGGSLFVYCSNLMSVNMPNVGSLSSYAFQYCTSLKKLDLGNLSSIGAGAFKDSGLETLIVRRTGTTITTLSGTNAFDGTPIASGTGFIYVPKSLLSSFQSGSNWSNFSAQIRAIEDYPEICGG